MTAKDQGLAGDLVAAFGDSVFPGIGALGKRLLRPTVEEWQRRHSVALGAAERLTGLSREQLAEVLAENSNLIGLHTRLLYAAGMNGHDRTLRAMGAVLRDAVEAPERVNECDVILTSLADLNEAHFTVLSVLHRKPPTTEGTGRVMEAWSLDGIKQLSEPLPESLIPLCIATLISRGLAVQETGYYGSGFFGISELGRLVLDVAFDLDDSGGR